MLLGLDEDAAERAARAFGSQRRGASGDTASRTRRGAENNGFAPTETFLRLLLLGRWQLQRAPPILRRRGTDVRGGAGETDGAVAVEDADELEEETRRADPLVRSGDCVRLAQDSKFLQGRRWPGGPTPWAPLAGVDATGRLSSGDTWRIHLLPHVGEGAGMARGTGTGGSGRPAAQRGASTMAKAAKHLARIRETAERGELMPYRIFSERQRYREVRAAALFTPPPPPLTAVSLQASDGAAVVSEVARRAPELLAQSVGAMGRPPAPARAQHPLLRAHQ